MRTPQEDWELQRCPASILRRVKIVGGSRRIGKMCTFDATTPALRCSSGLMSSRIQMPRPCVPMTRSFSRGWILISSTGTVGRPLCSRTQLARHRPTRRPRFRSPRRAGSRCSRMLRQRTHRADGEAVRDPDPVLPEVVASVDIRVEVVVAMVVERNEDRTGRAVRSHDARHVAVGREFIHTLRNVGSMSRRRPGSPEGGPSSAPV